MFQKYTTLFLGILYFGFACVLILKKSPIKKANQILSFFFLLLAFYSAERSFYYTELLNKTYSQLIHYVPLDLILLLMLGPTLFRYIKVLLGKPVTLNFSRLLIQLLPFIPPIIYITYFLSQDTSTRINLLIVNFEQGIWPVNLLNLLVYFQVTLYLILCYQVILSQFRKSMVIKINCMQLDVLWLRIYIVLNLSFVVVSAPITFYLTNGKVNFEISSLVLVLQFVYLFINSTWQKRHIQLT